MKFIPIIGIWFFKATPKEVFFLYYYLYQSIISTITLFGLFKLIG